MEFTDGQFTTAREKEKIYRAWIIFLDKGLLRQHFTKALYSHLSLHWGFIAHYNIHGFYDARFEDPEGRLATFRQMLEAPFYYFRDANTSGCGDLNIAMKEALAARQNSLTAGAWIQLKKNLNSKKEQIEQQLQSLE